MLTPKSVHFIIPSFNGSGTIRNCLDSIVNQNYPLEFCKISVVENGHPSIDQNLLKKYPNCFYHYSPLASRSVARNLLINQVEEEYIAYIDVDVVLDISWLRESIASMTSKYCAAVTGTILRKGTSKLDDFRRKISDISTNGHANTMENPTAIGCMNTAAVLISTTVLKSIMGFDKSFVRSEDYELTQRILRSGYIIATSKQAVAEVYWDRSSFEYFISRQFQMGYFTAKANRLHKLIPNKKFGLKNVLSFKDIFFSICLILMRIIFNTGFLLGFWHFRQLKIWEPKIIIKRFFISNSSDKSLIIADLNPKWEILIIQNRIRLHDRAVSKQYMMKEEAEKNLLRLLNSPSNSLDLDDQNESVQGMIRDKILIKIKNLQRA